MLFFYGPAAARAAGPPYTITGAGGDCASIGAWDAATRTCTLTTDIHSDGPSGIILSGGGVTLDGAGHILAAASGYMGVSLQGGGGNTVTRLAISGFDTGVYVVHGFFDSPVDGNRILQNYIHDNRTGIDIEFSDGNQVIGNVISANGLGIQLQQAEGSMVSANDVSGNTGIGGIYITLADGNQILDNIAASNNGFGISVASAQNTLVRGNTCELNLRAPFPGGDYNGAGIIVAGRDNRVLGNNLARNGAGLLAYEGPGNTVSGNKVQGNTNGIYLSGAHDSSFTGNTVEENDQAGIMVRAASDNVVSGNTLAGNHGGGLAVEDEIIECGPGGGEGGCQPGRRTSDRNRIFRNNLLDNTPQAWVTATGADNAFFQPLPLGGNYWNEFDTPTEGCLDTGVDGFCDMAYLFSGGSDSLPRTQPYDGCGKAQLRLSMAGARWASYEDFLNRQLTVDFSIRNSGSRGAYGIHQTGSSNSQGVRLVSQFPQFDLPGAGFREIQLRYHVPYGVVAFRTELRVGAGDDCGASFAYP